MKRGKIIVLLIWDARIGGAATSLPSIINGLKSDPRTYLHVFLKRRGGLPNARDNNVSFHYFSDHIYKGKQLSFGIWILKRLFALKPTHILAFFHRFGVVAALYKILATLSRNKTKVVLYQPVVTSKYFFQHEPWYWRQLSKLAFLGADKIITNTKAVTDDLRDNFSISSSRITCVPNWILTMKKGRKSGVRHDCIFVGRLSPEKGIDTLIDTAALCKKKLGAFSMLIVGDGPIQSWLHNAIKERALGSCVTYLGYRKNPRTIMKNAKLLLLPSYNEGMPMVILEAYSLGIPVAVTPFLGAEEVVDHNITGVIVNRDRYPEAVYKLLLDEKRLEMMGRAGLEKAKREFSVRNLDRFIEEIFNA